MLRSYPGALQPEPDQHERYDALCALVSSGALSASDWRDLAEHLQRCEACRQQLPKYQEIASAGVALLAPEDPTLEEATEWSPDAAVARLMDRLQRQEAEPSSAENDPTHPRLRPSILQWISWPRLDQALTYAAAAIVFATVSWSLYVAGLRTGERHAEIHRLSAPQPGNTFDTLLRQRADLEHQLQARAAEMNDLEKQLRDGRADVSTWQALKQASDKTINSLEENTKKHESDNAAIRSQNRALADEQIALSQKLQESELTLAAAQHKFDSMQNQHAADMVQITKLEAQIANASRQQQEQEIMTAQAELPAPQRDLRDLMGARDLFIADVYDIDRGGLPQKPFGRVFYTKGKSLVFYAFYLDRQPGAKTASSFQVWGRRGFGDNRPLSMGAMYLESSASKRWVLKFSDAKTLSQIEPVFVTLEPGGSSDMPKGRQLLYASLRIPSNHP